MALLGLAVAAGPAYVQVLKAERSQPGVDAQVTNSVLGILPDLVVTITDSPDPVATGQDVQYDINVSNNGTAAATMVAADVFYSAALTPVPQSTPGWTCNISSLISCTLNAGSIPNPGAAPLLQLRFTAPATAQNVQVSVTASALEADTNPLDNTNIVQSTQVQSSVADLNLGVTASATSVAVGTPVSFTANVNNAGPGAAPSLQVSGNLGGAIVFSNFSVPPSWNCTHVAGAINCNYLGGTPSGTLPSGVGAAPIVINGVAGPGSGTATVSLAASSAASDPTPATANGAIAVTAPPPASVDLSLTKTVVGAQPIPRGVPFTYRMTVANSINSSQTASSIQISDPLPAGIVFQSASGAGWSCTANVVCNYSPTLAAGQTSASLDLLVTYDNAVPQAGVVVSNTATVSSADPDPDPANNQSTALASIRASADLAVQLNAPSPVVGGTSFVLDLTANNLGPDVASNVTATATVAAGFNVGVVSGGAGWSCLVSGQSVSCQRAAMAAGVSMAASLTLTAPASAAGPFNLQGSVSSTSFDPVSSNDTTTLPITVSPAIATLALTKTDSLDPVAVGAPFDYVLTVTNTGNISQSALTIADPMPSGLSYLNSTGSGWNCTASSGQPVLVNCSNPGPLAPGASSEVRLSVRGDAVGSVINNAQVSSQQNGSGTSASQSTQIIQPRSLTFTKVARATTLTLGEVAVFDLTVTNTGQSEVVGLIMLDNLPQGLNYQSASGAGWTCGAAGALVDCRLSSLQPSATSTVVLEALPAAAGSYVNRADLTALQIPAISSIASITVSAVQPPTNADLAVAISDSVDPAQVSTPFNYLISVRNIGPAAATGIRVVNSPSLNLAVLGTSSPGWTCPLIGSPECTFDGPLAPGAETLLSLRVRGDSAGSASNSVAVSATELDPVSANNTAQENTQIGGATISVADLTLNVAGPSSAAAGSTIEVSASMANIGPSDAGNVLLRARNTGAFVLQSGSGGGFSCIPVGTGLDCRATTLAAGASAQLLLQGDIGADASGQVQVALDVTSAVSDPNPGDNSAVVSINVTSTPPPPSAADLRITQTVSNDPLAFDERFSYTLVIDNLGPAAASDVVVTDVLPAGAALVSATGAGVTCTGAATLECRSAVPLLAGQQLQVIVTLDAPNERATLSNDAAVLAATSDPVPGNNRSLLSVDVLPPTGDDAGDALMQATLGDPLAEGAVSPVVNLCDGSSGEVSALCDALFQDAADGNTAAVNDALRALYPEEVLSQHESLNQLVNTQSFNVDARLTQLHSGGGGGVNLSGLNVINGTQAIPIALLQSLFQSDDEPEIGGPGDLISPWGFFVNGTISRGDQNINGSNREVVLDFDSVGVTAGVDYRRSARWVMGAALGFDSFNSALTDDGKLETRAITLTGYNAYYLNDLTYLDSRLSYGRVSLDQTRRLRIDLTGFTLDETLTSDTQANQLTLATSFGHHFSRGAWTFTPNAFVRYMRSTVDGFAERGSDFAVRYGDQTVSSLVFGAGLQVNRVISLSNGVLMPQFDLIWNHESRNNDTEIDASFVSGDPGEFFSLSPQEPDKSYGSVGFGLVYVLANGKQAYLQWRESVGVDGLSRSTVNLGARFEF